MGRQCKSCVYSGDHHTASFDVCRKNPPLALVDTSTDPAVESVGLGAVWPCVDLENDWCGEYKPYPLHDGEPKSAS